MNKKIKEQLNKVTQCEIPKYDDDTTEMIIKCIANKEIGLDFADNMKYRIELSNYLLIDNDNFSFHSQWNKGVVPADTVMDVVVLQTMTKMVKVHGYGIDPISDTLTGREWEGWLPKKSVKIIAFY